MEIKSHIETIKKVKKFLEENDLEGLKNYIKLRELEILVKEDKANNYIDDLVHQLK